MVDIAGNIRHFKTQIPSSVTLIAVSKTKPVSLIMEAYSSGQRNFGENRVQELLTKRGELPEDIRWHLIGHLQRNKVKFIVPFISMIQSVDTFRLLETINSEAMKIDRKIDCLLQVHIAEEETKFGFSRNEIDEMAGSSEFTNLRFVRICGLMGMATFTDNTDRVHKEFRSLSDCFISLKNKYFADRPEFSEISMGMSDDYKIAIQEGSTMVRIGSLLFGERNTNQ